MNKAPNKCCYHYYDSMLGAFFLWAKTFCLKQTEPSSKKWPWDQAADLEEIEMLLFTELHVNKHIQADLCKIGLSTYKQFITYDGGELVSRYLKNPVRKIQVNINGIQKAFFLKQSQTPPPMKRVIRTILTGRLPHTTAYGEMLAAQYYQKLGIPVMNPVCWGEQRILGRPLSGFLMVEEIKDRKSVV